MHDADEAFKSVLKGKRASLLREGRFSAVTQPGCLAKNRNYIFCANAAYSTSVGNMGLGCPAGVPGICNNPEGWLSGGPN
jgi:hypothetical protein